MYKEKADKATFELERKLELIDQLKEQVLKQKELKPETPEAKHGF